MDQQIFSPLPNETVSLEVEASPVWEVILGIAGYTHGQLRHTFELDGRWKAGDSSISESLKNDLKMIEETNLWYGLILLQNKLSAGTVQDFSNTLMDMPANAFYETLLPYLNRKTEPVRKDAAVRHQQDGIFERYAEYFKGHAYLGSYICSLSIFSRDEVCSLFNRILHDWYAWAIQAEEWKKWMQALNFEKQCCQHGNGNPVEEIERITGEVKYIPEPSVWAVKLVPHVSYRPWVLGIRTPDTKLFFYPLKEEYLLELGTPSYELISGHKALGDEFRLKLLHRLFKGPLSLQEMSQQFNISKTTLHHQLSILKAARFISADKGIYSANTSQILSFPGRLAKYLGAEK